MLMDEFLPKDFDDGFDDPRDALLVEEDDDATTADLFEDDTDKEQLSEAKKLALFPGLWRNHEAGRWRPREEPFSGFKSPSGRFHHMERNDRGLP